VSYVEYAACALLRLKIRRDRQTDRQMDGHQTVALHFPPYASSEEMVDDPSVDILKNRLDKTWFDVSI